MKGFAMLGIGKTGWIHKEKPGVGPLDAVVRPLALAPCTSDVHTVWEGSIGDRHDMILGHEAVGEIVELGEFVKDFQVGDRVIVPAITPNWAKRESQMGFPQHSGGMLSGWKFSNFKDGVFAEYFHVNEADANLAKLPREVEPWVAVMLCDMVATGFHGAELAEIEFGDTVVVMGIGPVGLMSVAGANLKGASRIIAIGSRPVCVKVAKAYGATDIVNYKEGNVVDQVYSLTHGKGVDKVIIAGGEESAIGQGVAMVRPGGIVANVNYFGQGDSLPIPRVEWGVGMGHKTIKGGLTPGGRVKMEKLADLVKYGKLDPSLLVTHRLEGLEKVEDALLLMKEKPEDLIKPVVTISYESKEQVNAK